jgi:colanic acid biosynthesis glycosyl transferase WcaI
VELGQLNRPWAILLSTWLERACYHHARHIVVVTQGIKDILLERGYPAEKISLIPNGANVELYHKQPVDRELMDKFGFDPGCFVLIFTGLVGLAHDLETVLKAADILRHTSARFLIVGDGPKKEDLLEMRSKLGLQNVIFNEAVPEQELPAYLSIAHAGLCTGLSLDITRKALPVKMFTYMACELPVILTLEGESAQLLRDARAGLVVVPENPIALADAISELMADPDSCLALGLNGRRLAESRFSRQMQAHDLAMLLANSQ